MSLLDVKSLNVTLNLRAGSFLAVQDLSFSLNAGETLGIIGESGCGKSLTSLALMGLLPPVGVRTATQISFEGQNLLDFSESKMRTIRGGAMSMIFQDPMTSLNPSFTVEMQICETLKQRQPDLSRSALREKAISILTSVGIPSPEQRLKAYPHQLSGGMCQRVMIAIAIACNPKLLIADEPTTALDVTIQTQILDLLKDIQSKTKMAMIIISHDMAVMAKASDKMLVMYAGRSVEQGPTSSVLSAPKHPYTAQLLHCLPSRQPLGRGKEFLPTIEGVVPSPFASERKVGCPFAPRCQRVMDQCRTTLPEISPEISYEAASSIEVKQDLRWTRCHIPFSELKYDA